MLFFIENDETGELERATFDLRPPLWLLLIVSGLTVVALFVLLLYCTLLSSFTS